MKIAIEGCAHGELEKIYAKIQELEERDGCTVSLLLCCGDFQSTRNLYDLQCMAVNNKFRNMGSFYKYYSGELVAPILTIFIGGNHEASNYLQELPYGGWVAPNIYYLGYAGVVNVNGLRIGGLSGIYKAHDYLRGRHEFAPYSDSTCRSVYHVRQLEVFRLKQLSGKLDIMMSHDWPHGIYDFGDKNQLLRAKPFLSDDILQNRLGSRPARDLLEALKPKFWYSAHLHCYFEAEMEHPLDGESSAAAEKSITRFTALDKCLYRRRFLKFVDIEVGDEQPSEPLRLEYDLEWLTILKNTNHLLNTKWSNYYLPGPMGNNERYNFTPTADELASVRKLFNDLRIPEEFFCTVEPYAPPQRPPHCWTVQQPLARINKQTTTLCDLLQIDDPVEVLLANNGFAAIRPPMPTKPTVKTPLNLPAPAAQDADKALTTSMTNPDEIDLNDDDAEAEPALKTTEDEVKPVKDEPITEKCTTVSPDDAGDTEAEPMAGKKHACGGDEKAPTAVKKFKRRNETIYNEEPDMPAE